ncbi:MAG: WGR domain-containing protein [Magnetococcales bacterium]|nr:WGR domain-containing protein [Magnetococcales bacterium]NGZ25355.1 WGR domain-containing protein [Magnetococcales bacterium]
MKAYLQRLSPESNQLWYFSIQIQMDLLGRWQVMREWGKYGSPGTLRKQPFESLQEAMAAFSDLKEQLMSKGYQVVMQEGLKPAMAKHLVMETAHESDS